MQCEGLFNFVGLLSEKTATARSREQNDWGARVLMPPQGDTIHRNVTIHLASQVGEGIKACGSLTALSGLLRNSVPIDLGSTFDAHRARSAQNAKLTSEKNQWLGIWNGSFGGLGLDCLCQVSRDRISPCPGHGIHFPGAVQSIENIIIIIKSANSKTSVQR